MTFDNDFMRLEGLNITLKSIHLEWPPPPFLKLYRPVATGLPPEELTYKRVRCSEITDEQRAGMTHVARGAEYLPCSADELPHAMPVVTQ